MATEKKEFELRFIESSEDMRAVEDLEKMIWPGDNPVPYHMLLAVVHNGGILVGAYDGDNLIGYVFGFLGAYETDEGVKIKHCSHQLGVHPDYQDHGLGFILKRAQWQLARQQGLDLITWTYDPLESRNAYFNLSKLGAVCHTYLRNEYGEMPDTRNRGIPSDRFLVQWWVNTQRVNKRLSKTARKKLDLAHFLAADAQLINTTSLNNDGWPFPESDQMDLLQDPKTRKAIVLFEVPADFQGLKAAEIELAKKWRSYSRTIFELLFHYGYLATDMVYISGTNPRSYYVMSLGNKTLGD
jgi:predicted GNAT superfamily acetyltransferase